MVFRKRVKSYNISTRDFVEGVQSTYIYGIISDDVAHKMMAFDPLYDDREGIKEMFASFGITPDEVKILTTQIILQPLPRLKSDTLVGSSTTEPQDTENT